MISTLKNIEDHIVSLQNTITNLSLTFFKFKFTGEYSHGNGWKLDVHMVTCMTNYIDKNFTPVTPLHYKEPGSGYIFYNENNHWDCCFHKGCQV